MTTADPDHRVHLSRQYLADELFSRGKVAVKLALTLTGDLKKATDTRSLNAVPMKEPNTVTEKQVSSGCALQNLV